MSQTTACPFSWYELMTTDVDAAQAFYAEVIGWNIQSAGMPDRDYRIITAGPVPVGGMMALPPEACAMGAQPGWLGYVTTPDLDATVSKLEAAGGTVHKSAQDIPGVGRFAVVADPQGAAFIAFQPSSTDMPPSAPMATPGLVGWNELHASDPADALAFYVEHFGWTATQALNMGPMGVYQMFATGGTDTVGGIMKLDPQMPQPFWMFYVNVAEVNAVLAKVNAQGGQVMHGPQQVPTGSWIAICTDPQGAAFAIVGPKAD